MVRRDSKGRHRAIRTCVGCGGRAPQGALIRFRVSPTGEVVLADASRVPGRSAYLHLDPECWSQFLRRKGRVPSLRRTLSREQREKVLQYCRDQNRLSEKMC